MSPANIGEIFRRSFDSFVESAGPQPRSHYTIARALAACRTPALGGARERCDSCGSEALRYHSCRNRHCPRCQRTARMSWVEARRRELLPVGYFHAVFTVPSELNPFALRNKKPFYELLFRSVHETITELAANPKYLGADIGFVAVLHTWGQTLTDHPHVHCIVPGGGFDAAKGRWKPGGEGFLFPVAVMRRLFRGKLMAYFREALAQGTIELHGSLAQYADREALAALIDSLYRKEWVVYIKRPFASAEALVAYLGAYTHRVAISDSRIVEVDDHSVSFTYKDYSDQNRRKTMRLETGEFIRRFLLHVLPEGFKRIRYYGFLAPRARRVRLNRCRTFFKKVPVTPRKESRRWFEIVKELGGRDPLRCRRCKKGTLRFEAVLPRVPWNVLALSSG